MKRREILAWVLVAAVCLLGATSISQVSGIIQSIASITSIGSLSNVYSGATRLSVSSHVVTDVSPVSVNAHKAGTWLIDHTSSVGHVAIVGIGVLDNFSSASLAAINASIGLTQLDGYSSGAVSVTGSWVGGLQVEMSMDAGTTYFPRTVWNETLGEVTTIRSNGIFTFPVASVNSAGTAIRARMVDYTSGTAVTRIRVSRAAAGPTIQHLGGNGFTGARCHSQASFVTTAIEQIVLHTGNQQRLFICGLILLPSDEGLGENVAIVEGTTAACKTGTTAVFGGQAPHLAAKIHSATGFVQVSPTSWLSTQTAGNPLCIHKGGAVNRLTGTIIYGAYP